MKITEILIENTLFEGIELPYKGYVIKAFTLKNSNTAKAWVGDRNGNQVTNITKLFPVVEVGSEEEAVEIQKQKIDDYTNTNSVVTKYFKTYPNKNLQSILHLPDHIYMGVDSGGIVYISTKSQPGWLRKSITYADGSGTGTPIHVDDLKRAGLEPGTRYEVISKEVMDPDTVALKIKEYNRITHSGDKDDNRVPLIVIQMAGRNKGVGEAANPAQQAAIAISKKKEQGIHEEEGMFGRSKNDKRYLDKFDPTEVMNISDDPGMKAHKTTGKGSLRTSKEDLEFAFGPPGEDDTWVLEFSNGLIATIYPQDNSGGMDWIIGGNHSNTEDFVHMAYSAAQDEKLEEDWQKVNKKDKTSGMSKKAVSAYRRENPGSKLKTAVTTKPSKLKKGSKAANRRKSFCARMGGMKKSRASAKTKRDPDSPINKALRRWNCESVQQMEKLVMIAEQKIRNLKK
jgi:hypothetical protein